MPGTSPPQPRRHPRIRLAAFDYSDPSSLFLVTVCSRNRMSLLDVPGVPEIIVAELRALRGRFDAAVYAHCLMPDHIHALLHLGEPGYTLGEVVGAFKSLSSRGAWPLGWRGGLWQPRFHDRILRQNETAEQVAEYIIANPVRQGLVAQTENWPYSGAFDLI